MRLFALLLSLLIALPAQAVVFSRITVFQPNTPIKSADVNGEFDNIISGLNGNLDAVNLGSGAFATANIANNAITTAKIAPGAVTTDKIATGGVQTSNILAGAITQVTRAALTQATSNTTNTILVLATADTEIASTNITTVGRPVFVQFVSNSINSTAVNSLTNGVGAIHLQGGNAGGAYLTFLRDGATQNVAYVRTASASFATTVQTDIPCSSLSFIDFNAGSGSHLYELRGKLSGAVVDVSDVMTIVQCQLAIFEL